MVKGSPLPLIIVAPVSALFQITQATPRFCKLDIIAVEDSIFEIPFRGLLR